MNGMPTKHDLVVLVPDKYMEYAVRGILTRAPSLKIKKITYEIYTHPEHDPGCFLRSPEFLKFEINQTRYALVMLDYEGCGQEHCMSRQEIESDIETRMQRDGWGGRANAVVIEPELENWIWSDSPHVERILGWQHKRLHSWLMQKGLLQRGENKPTRPKEVLHIVLKEVNKSKSASMYKEIAEKVSLNRCVDPSFNRFKNILQNWFSQQDNI